MKKHDYTLSNISAISDSLISCGNIVENSILSVEAMPYSWDTGLLHTVVQWFEVLQILGECDKLARLMQKADQRLAIIAENIGQKDLNASASLDSGLTSLDALNSTASNLLTELSDYAHVQETNSYTWMNDKQAQLYKVSKYVTYDVSTEKYVYNAAEIANIFEKKENATVDDYETLSIILSTMVNDDGTINTDALEGFLELAYTDGLPLASCDNAQRDGTVLKELSGLMELRKNATAHVNKEYLVKDDIHNLTEEEKTKLKRIKAEIAMCSIVIAAAEMHDTTSLNVPPKYKKVGNINVTTNQGLGITTSINGIVVEENKDVSELAKFKIKYEQYEGNGYDGTYKVKLNEQNVYDVYTHTSDVDDIYTTTNETRTLEYSSEIKRVCDTYVTEVRGKGEYTDEYIEKQFEKKVGSKSEEYAKKGVKFVIKQIPIVSNVAEYVDVAYEVANDTYEWHTGYEEEVREINEKNDAVNRVTTDSKRYVDNLTSDNNQGFRDSDDGKCYTATYYYNEDKLVVDDGSMLVNEERAAENVHKKSSFKD